MPQIITQDWSNGPMGPGFFMLFRRNIKEFFDGGPMDALLAEDETDEEKKRKRQNISFAVAMLMRAQS